MNALEREPHSQMHRVTNAVTLALDDPQTRMYLLSRLVAKIESGDALHDLVGAGMQQSAIDQLRSMSMSDAIRFAHTPCGLSLAVHTREVEGQLRRVEHAKLVRTRLEYFIRNGATPRLLTQLFGVSPTEARRLRKQLAPSIATGGRTKEPTVEEREAIEKAWQRLKVHTDQCERVWQLHQEFRTLWISTLELVILPRGLTLTPFRK